MKKRYCFGKGRRQRMTDHHNHSARNLIDLLFRRDKTGRHRLISSVATVELDDLAE